MLSLKDIIKKVNKHAIHWEKILTIHTSDKRFMSKIHKEPPQINKKDKQSSYKVDKTLGTSTKDLQCRIRLLRGIQHQFSLGCTI